MREFSDNELKEILIEQIKLHPINMSSACFAARMRLKLRLSQPQRDRMILLKHEMINSGEFKKTINNHWKYVGDQFFYGELISKISSTSTPTLFEEDRQ